MQYSLKPPSSVQEYYRQFTLISQKVVEASNLKDYIQGVQFVKGLLFKYRRYTIAKTGADLDRRNLFNFYRLKGAIEDRFNISEGAD